MMWDVPAMVEAGTKLLDKIIPDADAKNKAKAEWELAVLKIASEEATQQSSTNVEEAKSSSMFVAGWRPAVGWICASGFFWATVGQPVFSWVYVLSTHQPAPVIALPTDILMTTLLGMLGLGTLRTLEKIRGVASTK